jgi:hypothetical protein
MFTGLFTSQRVTQDPGISLPTNQIKVTIFGANFRNHMVWRIRAFLKWNLSVFPRAGDQEPTTKNLHHHLIHISTLLLRLFTGPLRLWTPVSRLKIRT